MACLLCLTGMLEKKQLIFANRTSLRNLFREQRHLNVVIPAKQ
jgi:hypothetical protein